jgi:hypothetical protein
MKMMKLDIQNQIRLFEDHIFNVQCTYPDRPRETTLNLPNHDHLATVLSCEKFAF